jgi:hypothetical protein
MPPRIMRIGAPWLYLVGVLLLVAVAVKGDIAMGARRWLDLGFVRFQPSEIMKIAMPLACAWYLPDRPLPPDLRSLVVLGVAILVPALLIAEQPDLGTALLVTAGGGLVVLAESGARLPADLVILAIGVRPETGLAREAGLDIGQRGGIVVDAQMRTNVPHIFAIGDLVGQPMLAHKAVHEAHVAAEVAAGHKAAFDATVIPGVAYTHPEVAWVGYTEEQARKEGRKVESAKFPWAASGRAIANGAEYGFTKLIFDAESHRVIGGAIVGPNAGDMIGEVCLAIEMGCDAVDIGKTIHPHPTLGETVGMAAEVAHGTCTDVPPPRRK